MSWMTVVKSAIRTARFLFKDFDSSIYRFSRKHLEFMASLFIKKRNCVDVIAGGVPAEWLNWQRYGSDRVILYLHGGAYVLGSPNTHRDLVYRISRASEASALVIDYRLAPEHPQPAAMDDAVAAYNWLLEKDIEPSRIAVMGDSAGGGLTVVLLQTLRDRKIPMPACAACLSPWTDISCSGKSMWDNAAIDPLAKRESILGFARLYAGGMDLKEPSLSPLYGDVSNLPPILIQVGTEEVLLDDSRRIAEKAEKTNTKIELEIWQDMIHVFQCLARIVPQARMAIKHIGMFINNHMP